MNNNKKKNAFLGAIAGDIIGSVYEWNNIKTKEFPLFNEDCRPTYDSVMTLAVADALIECHGDYSLLRDNAIQYMRLLGSLYPDAGYGGRFSWWLQVPYPAPYDSYGNGSAMRVSAVAYVAKTLEEVKELSCKVTDVTHNHIEGLKGAEATAVATFMALQNKDMTEIRTVIDKEYYPMNFTLDGIRDSYRFNETCQDTVPQALMAFFESTSYEDAIRNAISIGGDSDTLGAITGAVAGAYYGVQDDIALKALSYMDDTQKNIYEKFVKSFIE